MKMYTLSVTCPYCGRACTWRVVLDMGERGHVSGVCPHDECGKRFEMHVKFRPEVRTYKLAEVEPSE